MNETDGLMHDVVVAGAGPVGGACALLLRQALGSNRRLLVLDARDDAVNPKDRRMIAVSSSTRGMLNRVGAFASVSASAIRDIHVSHRGAFGRTRIQAADYQLEALGYVVPYAELVEPILAALGVHDVPMKRGVRIIATTDEGDSIKLGLSDGGEVFTRYLVHAEGGLFAEQTPKRMHRDYAQTALTGFVTVTHALPQTAFERFTEEGPIALLPARRDGVLGYSLVWCSRPDDAHRRMHATVEEFLAELQRSFGDRLGTFLSITDRGLYPLGLNVAERASAARQLIIGNAAQTLHPVAGQGFNLGIRDAWLAAESIADHFDDPEAVAREFLKVRQRDRRVTIGMTDFLPRVFASRLLPVRLARGAALTLLDCVAPLRHPLARQMMRGQR